MARSKSSDRWLREHHADRFVQQARSAGYRARSSFKLRQLQEKDRLIRRGDLVVDLGAAPGGWSQVVVECTGAGGRVVASDILPMEDIAGVSFVCGDFSDAQTFDAVVSALAGRGADLVLSDMAPNMSGIRDVDQPRAMQLAELALEFARKVLKKDGKFVCKVFQGEGFDAFIKALREDFGKVWTRKPEASRGRSREVYVIASGFRCPNGERPDCVVE
jgi:23S rRNA (uridine2552-2'-O)-methyltransferase